MGCEGRDIPKPLGRPLVTDPLLHHVVEWSSRRMRDAHLDVLTLPVLRIRVMLVKVDPSLLVDMSTQAPGPATPPTPEVDHPPDPRGPITDVSDEVASQRPTEDKDGRQGVNPRAVP